MNLCRVCARVQLWIVLLPHSMPLSTARYHYNNMHPNLALLSGWAPLCPDHASVPLQSTGPGRGSGACRHDDGDDDGADAGPSALYEVVASQCYDQATQQQVRWGLRCAEMHTECGDGDCKEADV